MTLMVNGSALDLEIGPSESFGEVLARADELLEKAGLVITALAVDGRAVDAEGYPAVKDLPASGVQEVAITVESSAEYRSKAHELFISLIADTVAALRSSDPSWAPLAARALEFTTDLSGLFSADELSLIHETERLIAAAGSGQGDPEARSAREELAAKLPGLEALFAERLAELRDPIGEMRRTAALFSKEAPELKELSIHLQTGKEDRAMKSVLLFIEIFNKVIRLMPELDRSGLDTSPIRIDGQTLPEFYASFNSVLRELSGAFESKDSVLIGDLAEYEVAPRMAAFFAATEEALSRT